jgi:hypothetical protein
MRRRCRGAFESTRSGCVALVVAALVLASGATAEIVERKVAGIWKGEVGQDRGDTIRIMKRHIFERQIVTYTNIDVKKPDGTTLSSRQVKDRIVDRGRWQLVENRIRLQFNREINGVDTPRTDTPGEDFHTAYLNEAEPESGAPRLVLDEIDDRKLEGTERLVFAPQLN